MSIRKSKNLDQIILGPEPIFSDVISDPNDIRLGIIYNWYNYFTDGDIRKKYFVAYMTANGYSTDDIALFEKHTDGDLIKNSTAAICRLLTKNCMFSNEISNTVKDFIENKLEHINQTLDNKKQQHRTKVNRKTSTNFDLLKSSIEEILDEFYRSDYTKCEYNLPHLLELYKPSISEVERLYSYYEAVANDISFNENISKKQKKSYNLFMKTLLAGLRSYAVIEPAVSDCPASSLIKLNYLKKHETSGLKSVDPLPMPGSTSVCLYNVKYGRLTHLLAETDNGLYVRGTTIYGFSAEKSSCKTFKLVNLLKSLKTIRELKGEEISKFMTGIKSKPSKITGRLGLDTIIVKIN